MNVKLTCKNHLLRLSGIKRFHIVGCSRSGTTMLFYAMSAFEKTRLYDKETTPWSQPDLKESMEIVSNPSQHWQGVNYITKRHRQWCSPENVKTTIQYALQNQATIINIVRDPRDVLTSKHPYTEGKFYVEPELWRLSAEANERLAEALEPRGRMFTIRYEDLVRMPRYVELLFKVNCGLQLRRNVTGIDRMKDNVENGGVSMNMVKYMHKLRNFDPNSIGRWRNDERKQAHLDKLFDEPILRGRLESFIKAHEYDQDFAGQPKMTALVAELSKKSRIPFSSRMEPVFSLS